MWQREQKPSSREPEPLVVCGEPMSKVDVQSLFANGLRCDFLVPSGGSGVSQSPSVAVSRAIKKNAARQPGSRQALDIIEPFHSAKIWVWQVPHVCGLPEVAK